MNDDVFENDLVLDDEIIDIELPAQKELESIESHDHIQRVSSKTFNNDTIKKTHHHNDHPTFLEDDKKNSSEALVRLTTTTPDSNEDDKSKKNDTKDNIIYTTNRELLNTEYYRDTLNTLLSQNKIHQLKFIDSNLPLFPKPRLTSLFLSWNDITEDMYLEYSLIKTLGISHLFKQVKNDQNVEKDPSMTFSYLENEDTPHVVKTPTSVMSNHSSSRSGGSSSKLKKPSKAAMMIAETSQKAKSSQVPFIEDYKLAKEHWNAEQILAGRRPLLSGREETLKVFNPSTSSLRVRKRMMNKKRKTPIS